MPFPIDSFGDAFLAGEGIGFIEDHARTCRRCGRESFYGEDGSYKGDDYGEDYLCRRCRDDYGYDEDEEDDRDYLG